MRKQKQNRVAQARQRKNRITEGGFERQLKLE